MRKGVIVYVTRVEEEVSPQGAEILIEFLRAKGITTVFMASSEEEAIHGWFHLLTRGISEVLLLMVAFNASTNTFESRRALQLCGGWNATETGLTAQGLRSLN